MTLGAIEDHAVGQRWQPRSRRMIALLALFIMLGFGDKAILGLVGPPMSADLGLSKAEFGLIGSSFSLLFCFSAIIVGLVGNRVSPRWLLAGLALVWSVAQLPILIPAAGFTVLIITRILLGAGEGPELPLAAHTAFTWVPPRRRALAAAILAVGGSAGIVVGAPLMMLAMVAWGWRAPFGLLGALGLVWAVGWLLVGGPGPFLRPSGGGNAEGVIKSISITDVGEPATAAAIPEGVPYRRVFARSTWWAGVLANFGVTWSVGLALTWLPTYLEEQAGYRPAVTSLLVGLPSVASIVAILGTGFAADRLLRRGARRSTAYGRVPMVALVLGGLATLAMSRLGPGPALLIAMTVAFSAGAALTPLVFAAIGDISPPGRRSGALATAHALSNVGGVAAPFVSGLVVDLAPSQSAGFAAALDLAGVLLLVGAVLAGVAIRPDADAAALREGVRPPISAG